MRWLAVLVPIAVLLVSFCVYPEQGTLSGTLETKISLDFSQASFMDAWSGQMALSADYSLGSASFGIWLSLADVYAPNVPTAGFSGEAVAGGFSFSGDACFSVESSSFCYGIGRSELYIGGVSFSSIVLLVRNPTDPTPSDLYLALMAHTVFASGTSAEVICTLGSYVLPLDQRYLTSPIFVALHAGDTDGSCDLPFQRLDIAVTDFPFCCTTVSAAASFTCDGFELLEFTTRGIAVPRLPWLTLDALLAFRPQSKSLLITPRVDLGTGECGFSFHVLPATQLGTAPGDGPISLLPLELQYISYQCQMGELVLRTTATPTGQLMLLLVSDPDAGSTSTCCSPAQFALNSTFQSGANTLFELSYLSLMTRLALTDRVLCTIAFTHSLPGSSTTCSVGLDLFW